MKSPFKFTTETNTKLFGRDVKTLLTSQANLTEVLDYYSNKPRLVKPKVPENERRFYECLYLGDNGFKGGSFEDIFNEKDLSKLDKYNADHFKSFTAALTDFSSKRRVRSEYDGDWDYDKRYDISPFNKRADGKTKKRSIKIYGEVSFSGGTGSSTIDNYGAFIVSLVNYFERNGINVDLYLTQTGTGAGTTKQFVDRHVTHIKPAGAYLAKGEMLKVFSAVFFRRIGFSQIVESCDHMGTEVDHGLGSPFTFNKKYHYDETKNELHIFSNPSFAEQKSIVELLQKELISE